jgi:hypothetical protein
VLNAGKAVSIERWKWPQTHTWTTNHWRRNHGG